MIFSRYRNDYKIYIRCLNQINTLTMLSHRLLLSNLLVNDLSQENDDISYE